MADQRLGEWISPPGETIEDLLEEKGWSKGELASRLGCTPKHVSELLSGRAPLTVSTATALARVLGSTPAFWLERERRYREEFKRQEELEEFESEAGWLDEIPLRWMVKEGCVERYRHRGQQVEAALSWFGTATVSAWRGVYGNQGIAYRTSASFGKEPGSVAAWLRRAELEAERIITASWNRKAFLAQLKDFRKLTVESDPDRFASALIDGCAQHGVALVFAPTPPKCPASGLVKWMTKDKALLVLSLRHKSNDHLWFTFFHEAGHLMLHGKKMVFLEGMDGLDPELEREADAFAQNLLIPPDAAGALRGLRAPQAIKEFASRVGTHPGIVLGRLQREGLVPWNRFNHLKQRYDLSPDGCIKTASKVTALPP